MNNQQVAEIFSAMADMLDIQGANYHRIMAYRRASETVQAMGKPLEEVWREGTLTELPGIGDTLASKIDELMQTGDLEAYRELRSQIPEGVVALLDIEGIGPKTAARFWKELQLTTIEAVEDAARKGRLRQLHGFGAKSEQNVLDGIQRLRRRTGRTRLGDAWSLAMEMVSHLREVPGVVQVAPAGSLRRMRDTVGDLDILVASSQPEPVMARFAELPQVSEVMLRGATKTSIRTHDGLQVDLRLLEPQRWGTALQYFTGSQAHNIHLRSLALDRGLSLSEYALKRDDGEELLCATEEEVYAHLGLPFIPPELREDRGEIEAALERRLPALVELEDIRGDFQFHTTASDGRHTLWEMAKAAHASGLSFAVVTDHSHGLGVTGGLTVEGLHEQRAEVTAINERLEGEFHLLAGIEVEVRADGTLDLPDDALVELDLVVASMHSGLRQPREQVTARALAAVRNPHVDVLAHPTGRLIGEREGADLDMEPILQAAARTGTALEVNAHPSRLDLSDVLARRAIELGANLVISSDAHSVDGFSVLRFGVATARRGWATGADVLNTRSVEEILSWTRRA